MTKQIFWLRESPSGGWVTPFAYTGELPAPLLEQIENIPSDEIHLPYLERSTSLVEVLPLAVHSDPAGVAILSPEAGDEEYVTRYQVTLALAAAAHGDEDPGFHLTCGDGTAIDGRDSMGWSNPPVERERCFFNVYRLVSRAFQRCLRDRFLEAYFADPERYRDTEKAWPVLLFAASAPLSASRRLMWPSSFFSISATCFGRAAISFVNTVTRSSRICNRMACLISGSMYSNVSLTKA